MESTVFTAECLETVDKHFKKLRKNSSSGTMHSNVVRFPQVVLNKSTNNRPCDFFLSDIALVLICPETYAYDFFGSFSVKCPACNSTETRKHGWSEGYRAVMELDCFYLVKTRRYVHRNCKKAIEEGKKHTTFTSLNDKLVASLPPLICEIMYPFQVRSKYLVSLTFIQAIREMKVTGNSFSNIASLHKSMQVHRYLACLKKYLLYQKAIRGPNNLNTSPPVPFPNLDNFFIYPCIGEKTVRDIYVSEMKRLEPLHQASIAQLTARFLRSDHTFYVLKHARDTNAKQSYSALLTFMNELGLIVAFWVTSSKSLQEIEVEIEMLSARLGEVKCIWIDNPEIDGNYLSTKFRCENKYDVFHVLQLYFKECYGNSLRPHFLADISNSLYSVNDEDVLKLMTKMRTKNPTLDVKTLPTSFWKGHKEVRKHIDPKNLEGISFLLEKVVDSYRGKGQFKVGFDKLHKKVLHHLHNGKLTDPDGAMHVNIGTNETPLWLTFRSSSQLESFHHFLQDCFHGFNGSYELLHLILLDRLKL